MSLPRRTLPALSVATAALIAAGTFMALTPTSPTPTSLDSAASLRHWSWNHPERIRHSRKAPVADTQSSVAPALQPQVQAAPAAPATTQAPPPEAAARAMRLSSTSTAVTTSTPAPAAAATSTSVSAPVTPAPAAAVVASQAAVGTSDAAVGASDAGVPTSDLPGWHLALSEDFTRNAALGQFSSVYKGWAGYDGAHDTSGHGTYDSASTTTVQGGVLDEYLHSQGGNPRVMALTPPTGGSHQTYGRYAVRFRSDVISGYKIAWLLWPSNDNWSQGELDFPEADLDQTIQGYAHDVTGSPSHNAWAVNTGASMTAWHTAVIEWSPTGLSYTLDGQSWHTSDPTAVPHNPMDWVLQAETAENGAAPNSSAAGHIDIDWVAAWTAA